MNYHPAYPSAGDVRAYQQGEAMIVADIDTLTRAWRILAQAQCALAQLPELDYPASRLSIEDFRGSLKDAITDASGEIERLRSAAVELVEEWR